MFCSSCGSANADSATTCRVCGESLTQRSDKTVDTATKSLRVGKARWIGLSVITLLAATGLGFAVYYYRASQEFEITGELLYKQPPYAGSDTKVSPVAGARVLGMAIRA